MDTISDLEESFEYLANGTRLEEFRQLFQRTQQTEKGK